MDPSSERTDPLAPEVEACYDARGDLLGYCCARNGTIHVDLPDLASFSYERGDRHVRAVPHGPLAPRFILDTYHHCVLPLMLPALGTEVLHASAVAGSGAVAALCGESGTGKSTIAVALAQRGYAIWADDAVAVDPAEPVPVAVPLPFAVRLRAESARWLNPAGRGGRPVRLPMGPAPLALLCMLERTREATPTVAAERLEPAAACREALAHAYCTSVKDPAQKRRTISNYLTITARVPVYRIRFPAGLERLPEVLDAIEEVLCRESTCCG